MKTIVYGGPFAEVEVPALAGVTVTHGSPINVPDDLADSLVQQADWYDPAAPDSEPVHDARSWVRAVAGLAHSAADSTDQPAPEPEPAPEPPAPFEPPAPAPVSPLWIPPTANQPTTDTEPDPPASDDPEEH